MQQIEQEIRQFVVNTLFLGVNEGQFSNQDSFIEKGLVDSMGILHLITFVQEKYAVPVLDEEIITDNWDSVHRIANFVERKKLQNSQQ